MLTEIIEHLNQYPEGKILFDTPVEIKDVCVIHGAVTTGLTVWLMDGAGKWHFLSETDHNYKVVARAVKQKLMPVPSYADAYGTAF